MNPTETQTPPSTETPAAAPAPAPAPDPTATTTPPAGQPPITPVSPSSAGPKKNMKMIYAAVGLVVLVVLIYFLVS